MKSDVKQNAMWWSWVETCDKCGDTIRGHETQTSRPPNLEEIDLCSPCLRHFITCYLIDHNVPHETARQTYKK